MTRLSVNLNKIALLRNSRTIGIPSVTRCARICIAAGAHGITVHPRPDERHIRATDVFELAELLTSHPGIELRASGRRKSPVDGRAYEGSYRVDSSRASNQI